MTKVMVFDTETTGLPSKKLPLEEQPFVVQFAGVLVEMEDDGTFVELERMDQLIKPPIKIPFVTSQIHGIYDIDVRDIGPFEDYAEKISKFLNEPTFIVAHNFKFDECMMKTEYARLLKKSLPYDFAPNGTICTMEASRYYCNIPGKSKFAKKPKAPKLQELVKKTCGTHFDGAHNAMVDVEWTLKAFAELVKEKVVDLNQKEEEELTLF